MAGSVGIPSLRTVVGPVPMGDHHHMRLALVLYPGFTSLDIIGPHDVLSRLPDTETAFVAADPGLVVNDTGALKVEALPLSAMPDPDVLVVPGGLEGTMVAAGDDRLLAWLRTAHETTTWTTSVCTGSLILAAAGILDGVDATSHWAALEVLGTLGANPVGGRVVERGKIVTGAGVSAGIDMALTLAARIAGEDYAKVLQLGIEYDPEPPFDSGSPATADPATVELSRAFLTPQA